MECRLTVDFSFIFQLKSIRKKNASEVFTTLSFLVGHLQFMVGKSHDLAGHLILSKRFVVGQNVLSVFGSVGQFSILVGQLSLTYRLFQGYVKGQKTLRHCNFK